MLARPKPESNAARRGRQAVGVEAEVIERKAARRRGPPDRIRLNQDRPIASNLFVLASSRFPRVDYGNAQTAKSLTLRVTILRS